MAPQYESEPYGLLDTVGTLLYSPVITSPLHIGVAPTGDDIFTDCKQYH